MCPAILARSHGQNFRDFAVLYRTNAQSNAMEYSFKRNGIPLPHHRRHPLLDRAEVKDMLAYLCSLNNRSDDLRLRRIVNNPPRGLGGKDHGDGRAPGSGRGVLFCMM